jgi:hypothetical protein
VVLAVHSVRGLTDSPAEGARAVVRRGVRITRVNDERVVVGRVRMLGCRRGHHFCFFFILKAGKMGELNKKKKVRWD